MKTQNIKICGMLLKKYLEGEFIAANLIVKSKSQNNYFSFTLRKKNKSKRNPD